MKNTVEDRWIVVVHTVCMGDQPAWWNIHEDKTESPVTYETERQAWLEIADDYRTMLTDFMEDESQTSFDLNSDYSVIPCTLHGNGVITTEEHGTFYDPSEDPAKYGRA